MAVAIGTNPLLSIKLCAFAGVKESLFLCTGRTKIYFYCHLKTTVAQPVSVRFWIVMSDIM